MNDVTETCGVERQDGVLTHVFINVSLALETKKTHIELYTRILSVKYK